MRTNIDQIRATRTLLVLAGFIVLTLLASTFMRDHVPAPALSAMAVGFAVVKVRLVALDFLGLRHTTSPVAPALLAWASLVLLVAFAASVGSHSFCPAAI